MGLTCTYTVIMFDALFRAKFGCKELLAMYSAGKFHFDATFFIILEGEDRCKFSYALNYALKCTLGCTQTDTVGLNSLHGNPLMTHTCTYRTDVRVCVARDLRIAGSCVYVPDVTRCAHF